LNIIFDVNSNIYLAQFPLKCVISLQGPGIVKFVGNFTVSQNSIPGLIVNTTVLNSLQNIVIIEKSFQIFYPNNFSSLSYLYGESTLYCPLESVISNPSLYTFNDYVNVKMTGSPSSIDFIDHHMIFNKKINTKIPLSDKLKKLALNIDFKEDSKLEIKGSLSYDFHLQMNLYSSNESILVYTVSMNVLSTYNKFKIEINGKPSDQLILDLATNTYQIIVNGPTLITTGDPMLTFILLIRKVSVVIQVIKGQSIFVFLTQIHLILIIFHQ
jgi:hypothetical protein